MTDLTPESLAELRRMADAATPRPWGWTTDLDALLGGEEGEYRVIDTALAFRSYYVLRVAGEDAALIAVAVNTLPALMDAAERLAEVEAERDALAEEVADMVPRDWHGLMTILADVYPETAFPTLPDHEARDAGPRIVSLLRRVDALAAKVERVRAMHVRHSDHRPAQIINGPWYCCARAQLGAVAMDDCNVCGECWPCPTIRALDGTETDHG